MDDGKEEIELTLGQDTIDRINKRAELENKTFDEVIEDILRAVIIAEHEGPVSVN
jgi:hypothetical protein